MGISQSLPQTGYVKMVDIWMIFTMSYPFMVIACHCGIEVSGRITDLRIKHFIFRFS